MNFPTGHIVIPTGESAKKLIEILKENGLMYVSIDHVTPHKVKDIAAFSEQKQSK